ncbi:uncharacterized protein [Polyergus mexicanus]|uniref:uncharacterized protein n=1 Tax=Polyergus mexicanus TaxID=615972 RepID=UPI0038B4779E
MLYKRLFLGLRTALGFRNSTPNNVLLGEAKMMSIKDRATHLARNFMIKTMAYEDEDLKDNIEKLNKEELLQSVRTPKKKPMIITEAWNRVKEDKEKIRKVKKIFKLEENTTEIYTDGSRSEDSLSTGDAFYIPEIEIGYMMSLNKECSNFTAEACAVAKALQFMKNHKWKKDIIIYTDSLSVLKSLLNNKISAYMNTYVLEIRQRYFELQDIISRGGKKIILCWIPAHQGITGNEKADEFAKKASRDTHHEELEVSIGDFRRGYREEMFKNTIKVIKEQGRFNGIQYFTSYFKEKEHKPWFHGINEPRKFITWINRLRSNHYNLNESLARKGYIESARCSCGYEKEDINHFVFQCSLYDDIRINLNLNQELNKIGASRSDCIWNWLKKEELRTLKIVYNFIMKTGRII